MTPKYPDKAVLTAFIKEQTGIDVDAVDSNPCIYGNVSLQKFGFCGSLVIYRQDDGTIRAAPVPFGMAMLMTDEAA